MLDTTPNTRLPGNVLVDVSKAEELAQDVLVIPNQGVDLVPNIGIIGGKNAVLIVETGMGIKNAKKVLEFARAQAKGRKLYLTTTHFHPEHAFGAQVFKEEATYLLNHQQAEDLSKRGPGYLSMFRTLGKAVATELEDVELATPDKIYDQQHTLDLGNRKVVLRATGQAHTKGDQTVKLPEENILFTGDLAEANQFAIFPWFPPHDTDVSGTRWIKVMHNLEAENPKTVVPGHGPPGGPQLLKDVRTYLELLRDETWLRRDSAMNEQTIIEEVRAVMLSKHPEWTGQDWIEKGVSCLCTEKKDQSEAKLS